MIWLSLAAAATLVAEFDLESDDGGLTPEAGDLQWQWGVPTTGPKAALSGTRVWATGLGSPYLNDAEGLLRLPSVELDSLAAPTLSFWHWTDIDPSDHGLVEVYSGDAWEPVQPIYGYPDPSGFTGRSEGWRLVVVDLDGVSDLDQVRLRFVADASVQAAGWFIDEVRLWDGDVAPPELSDLDRLPDTEDLEGPYRVSLLAEDDVAVAWVEVEVSVDGAEPFSVEATPEGGRFVAELPAQLADTTVEYAALASDGENASRLPEQGYESFRVRLPAPTDLRGPEGRVVDVEAELDWTAPDSTHLLEGYRVWRDEVVVATVSGPPALVPLEGDDTFSVTALYDVGEGDPSEPLTLESARPRVVGLDPEAVWQGESLWLGIEGVYLLLVDGEVDLDLGEDIEVEALEVLDVDRCRARVHVAETAAIGEHALTLTTGEVQVEGDSPLLVLDGADRPALLSLEPAELVQGETGTLRLRATGPFEDLPLVDLGEGVVVERVVESTDDAVLVDVVVGPAAPTGWRPVEADDGRRLLTGVEFRVRAYAPPVETCAVGGGGAGWLLALLGLSLLRSASPAGRPRPRPPRSGPGGGSRRT